MWAGGRSVVVVLAPSPPNLTGFWSNAFCPQVSPSMRGKAAAGATERRSTAQAAKARPDFRLF